MIQRVISSLLIPGHYSLRRGFQVCNILIYRIKTPSLLLLPQLNPYRCSTFLLPFQNILLRVFEHSSLDLVVSMARFFQFVAVYVIHCVTFLVGFYVYTWFIKHSCYQRNWLPVPIFPSFAQLPFKLFIYYSTADLPDCSPPTSTYSDGSRHYQAPAQLNYNN